MRQTRTGRTRLPSRVLPVPKKCCADAESTSSVASTCSHTSPFSSAISSLTRAKGSMSGGGSLSSEWQRNLLRLSWLRSLTVPKVVVSETTGDAPAALSSASAVATRPFELARDQMRRVEDARPVAPSKGVPIMRIAAHRAAAASVGPDSSASSSSSDIPRGSIAIASGLAATREIHCLTYGAHCFAGILLFLCPRAITTLLTKLGS